MRWSPQLFLAGRPALRVVQAMLLAGIACGAAAQPREVTRGDLVLRSSTVSSERIDPATASRHGIEPSPNRAVLNVVVLRGRKRETIPADVTAASRSLTGVRRRIDLKEVRENGRVSYVGSYEFLPKEVLDIEITAKPLRPDQSRPLKLSYRERMGQPR
ncbi:MAG: DUF4426 domain-containing protein [Ramlibacter sp.]